MMCLKKPAVQNGKKELEDDPDDVDKHKVTEFQPKRALSNSNPYG